MRYRYNVTSFLLFPPFPPYEALPSSNSMTPTYSFILLNM